MRFFKRRGEARTTGVRVSKAGIAEAWLGVLKTNLGVGSFFLGLANSNTELIALGSFMMASEAGSATLMFLDKRRARIEAKVAALRNATKDSPPSISSDRDSYMKEIEAGEIDPTEIDYFALLSGTILKGPGSSKKPSNGIKRDLEQEVSTKVEMLDVGMVGSSVNDMEKRQIGVASDFLDNERSVFKGGKIRVIGMSFEPQNDPYDINAALRPIVHEYVNKNSHKPVVPGGARLIIVAPNTYKNVVVEAGGPRLSKVVVEKLQSDAAKMRGELDGAVAKLIKDNPAYADKIIIVECGDKICYSRENNFYLAPSDLNDLQHRMAEAAVPAFTEKLDKKINVSLSSGLVHIEGTDEVASPTIKVEPLVQPGDHNYDEATYAKALEHAQDFLEGGIVYRENGDISIEEQFTPHALMVGAPPELRITVSASKHSRFTINTHDANIETDGSLEEIRTSTQHGETSVKAAGLFVASSKDGDISVEEARNVAIKADSGVVTVGHVHKDCVVRTESSAVSVWRVKGNYHARSKNGDLHANGVDGGFDAETKYGKVSWKRAGVPVSAKGAEVEVGNVSAKASIRYNEDGNFLGVEGSWNLAEFRPDPNLLLEVYPPEPQPKQDIPVSNPAKSLAAAKARLRANLAH